ncbi:MAG: SulP family inorganic anion transporter, partial [Anaerolineae bacterium]|nr:SulP family inorganic anion transporter [Anaerolineae bacterium]
MSAALPRVDLRHAVEPAVRYLSRPVAILRHYERENLRFDLVAGLTVGVIMLPQAIAFAILAELPAVMGLYAAIIGSIAGALWGSSDQIHNGPTNANSILILSALIGAGFVPESGGFIIAAGVMAVMAGIFQLVLGLARLGILVNFVSYSVIVGFSAGAGVLIAVKQLFPLLGLSLPARDMQEIVLGTVSHLDDLHPATTLIGLATIVVLVVLPRISRRLPAALIAMLLAALAVGLFGLEERGVAVIGEIAGRLAE